jgi:hypothetical protein
MRLSIKNSWTRFKSAVPVTERKAQLILVAAGASFGSMAAISWPGKLSIISVISGYVASACGGMAFLLQFAMQKQTILQTKEEVTVTATKTTTATEIPVTNANQTQP